jgi:hypothetical protein
VNRRGPTRRRFLALAGAGTAALAGCTGDSGGGGGSGGGTTGSGSGSGSASGGGGGTAGSLPDGIYVQRYRESMAMQGTAGGGPYRVAFMYAAPHVFWQISGTETTETPRSGAIHGMAVPWHPDTGRVVPETGLTLEISRGGDLVSQEVIYPMLSQRMGYHYGGNFPLDGDGEYTARITVGAVPDAVRLTGAYEGLFREPVTVEVPFVFNAEQRRKVQSEELDAYGEPGAVKPMAMEMVPQATPPAADALPGEVLGSPTIDGARFVTAVLRDGADRFGGVPYLYTSARTRYNGTVLPAMRVEATVARGGSTAFEGALTRTFDPELGYHYGTALDALESGDEVTLSPTVPPQVARHEGYERAFLEMESTAVSV